MQNCAKRILVVDDETKIIEVIKSYLEHNGYEVYEATSGKDALSLFEKVAPSLVILDLMLPDLSGEEICMTLRKKSRVPIIMLTAKSEENDLLHGLNMGADDYITKPFSPKELVARVVALLRRTIDEPAPLVSVLSYNEGDLVIDTQRFEVNKSGNNVNLTPIEYKILATLVTYPSKTFTREEIICFALGNDFEGFDRTIDSHVKNLRQKIETDPKSPRYVMTVYGIGYRFGGE